MSISTFARKLSFGIVIGATMSTSAGAQVSAYLCDMKNYGRGYSNSSQYYLQFDQAKGQVLAYDGAIAFENNKTPVATTYKAGANGRYKFRYPLEVHYKNNTTGRADFNVTFFSGRNEVHLSVRYAGADNNGMGGKGKCKPTKPMTFK